MAKFRKKPVVIEAVLWDGSIGSLEEIELFDDAGVINTNLSKNELQIVTSEGVMTASQGDWVIKGIKGEFYPCKPDIFEATYDPA
jgi:hypothetical protein